MVSVLLFYQEQLMAFDVERFLEYQTWRCSFRSELKSEREEVTGSTGMAHGSKRELLQVLGGMGVNNDNLLANTDYYRETMVQSVQGKILLHHVYDGGLDGIQIAGWGNGYASVHVLNTLEGSVLNQMVFRHKMTTFDGIVRLEGEKYEPSFQIWIYLVQGSYSLDYRLPPIRGNQVVRCRMREGMEANRKAFESVSETSMPISGLFGGLTTFTCPTEQMDEFSIDAGNLSVAIENIPPPAYGDNLKGEQQNLYSGSIVNWSFLPE